MAQQKMTSDQQGKAHSKLKANPFKNAAMAMSQAVADDGILSRLKELRDAKHKAGEANPEPPGPQEDLTKQLGLEGVQKHGAKAQGDGDDTEEQFHDKKPLDHHANSTKESMHGALKAGGAQEKAPVKEELSDDEEDSGALSAVDRLHNHFNSPRSSKRSIMMGAPSKTDFKSGHARSVNKERSKK